MTRKLEELFDLPPNTQSETLPPLEMSTDPVISPETLQSIDKIEAALPLVKGLESSDAEMDELANQAIESYKSMIDLGMQVDARYAPDILNVASNMLGHAITAKTAKMNKKLKMIDLQLKKMALDQKAAAQQPSAPITSATGHVLDRNELLQKFGLARDKDSQKE